MNIYILIFVGCCLLLSDTVKSDLKIEVMKEGLLDLKTTILRSPNVTEFSGSAEESYIGGTSGELVPFFPIDGCKELDSNSAFIETDEKTGKLQFSTVNGKSEQVIVLMSRGGCSFNEKFVNAKKVKGVVGVLVFNGPEDTIPVEKIELTNPTEDLSGYLISNTLGLELYNKLIKYRGNNSNNNNLVDGLSAKSISATSGISTPYIEVTMTPISIDATNRANAMIQMALIAIIIILALSFGASIVIHMRNPMINGINGIDSDSNNERNSLIPIDVEFLQKLPLKTYKGRRRSIESENGSSDDAIKDYNNTGMNQLNNNGNFTSSSVGHSGIKSPLLKDEKCTSSPKSRTQEEENEWFGMIQHDWPMNDSCPICLDEFNANEVLNELPCGHCYHIACIQPWLQYRSPCCPLCKLDVREEFRPENVKGASLEGVNSNISSTNSNKNKGIKNIWNKLILKSSRIPRNSEEMTEIQPALSTAIPIDTETSQGATPLQIPQRALIQHESEVFHSVPLRE